MWRRLVDLRAGEERLVGLSALTLAGLVGAHTVLETARDALFLEKLPPSRLAWVYALLAGLSLVVARLNSGFVSRFGRRNALVFTLMATAYGTTLLYLAPRTGSFAFGLYLWSGLVGTLVVAQFWLVAGHVFTVAQGKRLFGPLAAGGVLGAVAGASASALLLRYLDVTVLLVIAPAIQLASAAVATLLPSDQPAASVARFRGARAELTRLSSDPYLRRLGLLIMLVTAAALVGDYLFKSMAAAHFGRAALGEKLALYYAALNAASLLVQLGLATYTVRRIGVVASAAVLPLLMTLGGAGIIVSGGLFSLVLLTKGFEGSLRHSLNRVSAELLWLPVPADLRASGKALADTVLGRGTQALVAGGLLLLAAYELDNPLFLAIVLTSLSAAAVLAASDLRGRYVELFRRTLARDPGEGESAALTLNLDTVEAVLENLSSMDRGKVTASIDLLVAQGRGRLVPSLILYHDTPEVLVHALARVATADRRDWVPLAERLLKHADERVRVAAVQALVAADHHQAVLGATHDASPTVRAHIAFCLAQHERVEDPLDDERVEEILELGAPDGPRARRGLLEAIGQRGDARWAEVVFQIARGADPSANEALAKASARLQDPRCLPILIQRLGQREGRAGLRRAIVSYGPAGIAALKEALADPRLDPRVRLHVPRTLSLFENQAAAEVLLDLLTGEPNGAVRFKALRGLGRLLDNAPVQLDRQRLMRETRRNLVEVLRLRALALPLARFRQSDAPLAGPLLLDLLEDKQRLAYERSFRLLKLSHRSEDLRAVHAAATSGDRHRRASALEFLDALTLSFTSLGGDFADVRELLRVLVDELPAEEQVRRGEGFLSIRPANAVEALAALMREGDRALATLAAECAKSTGARELSLELERGDRERRFITLAPRSAHA